MTYRERRERKAERLREWSAKREASAAAVFQAHERYRGDVAFNTQPGRIIERERVIAREERAFASLRKADDMSSRAHGIETQLRTSIYSDDADAIEQLTAKIDRLEAERDRIKRYNASCRKAAKTGGTGDLSILTEAEREDLATTARVAPYMIGKGGSMPAYKLTNLGGNISRLRERLAGLQREREQGPADRIIIARFDSECADCGGPLSKGQTIRYNRQQGARCVTCATEEA